MSLAQKETDLGFKENCLELGLSELFNPRAVFIELKWTFETCSRVLDALREEMLFKDGLTFKLLDKVEASKSSGQNRGEISFPA